MDKKELTDEDKEKIKKTVDDLMNFSLEKEQESMNQFTNKELEYFGYIITNYVKALEMSPSIDEKDKNFHYNICHDLILKIQTMLGKND